MIYLINFSTIRKGRQYFKFLLRCNPIVVKNLLLSIFFRTISIYKEIYICWKPLYFQTYKGLINIVFESNWMTIYRAIGKTFF